MNKLFPQTQKGGFTDGGLSYSIPSTGENIWTFKITTEGNFEAYRGHSRFFNERPEPSSIVSGFTISNSAMKEIEYRVAGNDLN